jgi:biopolymer transport protein ExbD
MNGTFKKSRPLESNFELQITALIDTLVIILIFLLKSIATDTLDVEEGKGLHIPSVVNGMTTGKGSRLDISEVAVSWNGQKYVDLKGFDVKHPLNGEDGWKALHTAIAATVSQEQTAKTFDGKLLVQADKKTPFPALQEILKAAKSHGYKDIRFVGAKYN